METKTLYDQLKAYRAMWIKSAAPGLGDKLNGWRFEGMYESEEQTEPHTERWRGNGFLTTVEDTGITTGLGRLAPWALWVKWPGDKTTKLKRRARG